MFPRGVTDNRTKGMIPHFGGIFSERDRRRVEVPKSFTIDLSETTTTAETYSGQERYFILPAKILLHNINFDFSII